MREGTGIQPPTQAGDVATPEEVRRVRLLECKESGHSFDVVQVWHRSDPQLVVCSRCGESWSMAHIADEARELVGGGGVKMHTVTSDFLEDFTEEGLRQMAAEREAVARELAEERLPHPLHRLVDHPGLLAFAYKLRPSWRPTFIGNLGYTTASAAHVLGNAWLSETKEPNVGVNYYDVAGHPCTLPVRAEGR